MVRKRLCLSEAKGMTKNMEKVYSRPTFRKMLFIYIVGAMIFTGCGAEKEDVINTGGQDTETKTSAEEARGETSGTDADTGKMAGENLGSDAAAETSVEDSLETNAQTDKAEAGDGKNIALANETAEDTVVDIKALQEENPDIFAWLYIPGTDIDCPVLQSEEADDYYESHNAYDETDEEGAIYTELANLTNMCDFNTVLHGKTSADGETGLFADLYRFADPDFFEKHKTAYLYLDGNLLTYEIFAAYERENTSLLRAYDFTYIAGCQKFLDDLYDTRVMGMNFREGWEDLTPYHFLITLTTQRGDAPDKQFVVFGGLVNDAAGTIDRVMYE